MTTLYTICTEYSDQATRWYLRDTWGVVKMTSFYTICTEYSKQTRKKEKNVKEEKRKERKRN